MLFVLLLLLLPPLRHQVYVPGMRSKALVHLLRNEAVTAVGGGGRVKRLSLDYYTRLLRFDDTAQAKAFIQLHQVCVSVCADRECVGCVCGVYVCVYNTPQHIPHSSLPPLFEHWRSQHPPPLLLPAGWLAAVPLTTLPTSAPPPKSPHTRARTGHLPWPDHHHHQQW